MKRKSMNDSNENSKKNAKIYILKEGRIFTVWVENAKKLLLCLDTCVKIVIGGEVLCVSGKALLCLTYATGVIEIQGEVQNITFEALAPNG